ncbi:unnamed protein product [Orchesella dallaii]|uniref:E3 ubiquitin-protein ligase n=1 Tax=Orchesella dallaii TaxID=48710 RepID=A0ABP1PKT7_9HEXA
MEDLQNCPICFEVPKQEIFQCINGHTICGFCIENLGSCPQCRQPYGTNKIRCRALEEILNTQTFDCVNKEEGCKKILKRQEIAEHADICQFDKNLVYMCQKLGYKSCNFRLKISNTSAIIKHFQDSHGAALETGNEVTVWHADFETVITSAKDCTWSPVLLNLSTEDDENIVFIIVGTVDFRRDSAVWRCVQTTGTSSLQSKNYEIQLGIMGDQKVHGFRPVRWTLPVSKLNLDYDNCLHFSLLEIPLAHINWYMMSVQACDIAVAITVNERSKPCVTTQQKLPEVWSFFTIDEVPESMEDLGTAIPEETSFGFICNQCKTSHSHGMRHKCIQCVDYDLCETCMEAGIHAYHIFMVLRTPEQSQLCQKMFIRMRSHKKTSVPSVPVDENSETVFADVTCNGCTKHPITGKRYKCLQCDDFNLCEECIKDGTHSSHIFAVMNTTEQSRLFTGSFEQIR